MSVFEIIKSVDNTIITDFKLGGNIQKVSLYDGLTKKLKEKKIMVLVLMMQ